MDIDWSELQSKLKDIIGESVDQTDTDLSKEIASLTTMSQSEIQNLFPEEADQQALVDLMTIVKGAQTQNDKISNIFSNAEKFGNVVYNLLNRI